jgi:hypothetical protein
MDTSALICVVKLALPVRAKALPHLRRSKMSGDGVVLQHRPELMAYLFVYRSYDLLISKTIRKISPGAGQ